MNINNVNLKLHNEIIDFYFYIRPSEQNKAKRQSAIQRITEFVMNLLPNSEVKEFGSHATGLYLPNADVDLVVISEEDSDQKMLKILKKKLQT